MVLSLLAWSSVAVACIVLLVAASHLLRLWLSTTYPPVSHLAVAVIVPCKGNHDPDFENNLLAIVRQHYDGVLHIAFCAESDDDPAVPTLRRLAAQFAHVQVCIAGYSTRCAQKTYNILKGIACVPEVDIFIFADADIQPHPTWVQEMVAPFGAPEIGAVTGFFRYVPLVARFRLSDYIAALFNAFMIVGVSMNSLKSVWGGSMAIRKAIMDRYNLYERLATEVVDDITTMHALRTHGIERRYVQSCTLKSYCDMSLHQVSEWFTRQMQFMQIYVRWLYAAFYLIVPYTIAILLSPLLLLEGLLAGNRMVVQVVGLFWLVTCAIGLLLFVSRPVNPASVAPGDHHHRLLPWLLATPLAFILGPYSLFKTLFRVKDGILTMHWRTITYLVDMKTGKVIDVIRGEQTAERMHTSLPPDEFNIPSTHNSDGTPASTHRC